VLVLILYYHILSVFKNQDPQLKEFLAALKLKKKIGNISGGQGLHVLANNINIEPKRSNFFTQFSLLCKNLIYFQKKLFIKYKIEFKFNFKLFLVHKNPTRECYSIKQSDICS